MRKIIIYILVLLVITVVVLSSEDSEVNSVDEDMYFDFNEVRSDTLGVDLDVASRAPTELSGDGDIAPTEFEHITAVYDSLYYEGDTLFYFVDRDKIMLVGNAMVVYSTATILADSISIDFERNQAVAQGRIIMEDREQLMIGDLAFYDIETETGIIFGGASSFDMGFYSGQEIRRVCADVFDVDRGSFTTCDAKHPHFDIRAHTMRVYRDHMVVGKPIIFHVNDFPIFALPFGAFSIRSGRRTGFLMPEPGYNSSDGKYFRNLAYYIVFSDYADVIFALDLMEKTGLDYRTELIYLDRYKYNGRLDAAYQHRTLAHDAFQNNWRIFYRHFHRLPERATFDATVDLASSRQVFENELEANRRLQERFTSRVSYRRPFTSSTFATSASYTDDFKENRKSIVLPSYSYSLPSRPVHELIPWIPDEVRRENHWWKNFSFRWSTRGAHVGTVRETDDFTPRIEHILYKNERDSQGNYLSQHHAGISQSAGVIWNHTAFGWMRLSNTFSYDDAIMDRDRYGNTLVHGYSYRNNSSLSFNLYGIRRFPNFPITAVRHIMTPTVGFSYRPDFSEQNRRFYSFEGVSVNSGRKERYISLGLLQRWQFRLRPGRTGHERSINDLLSLNSSTGYNLEAENEPWSDFLHTLTLRPGSYEIAGVRFGLDQSYSARQDPYKNFDVTSWRMNTNFSISGNAIFIDYFPLEQNDFITRNLFAPDTLSIVETQIRTLQDLERLAAPGNWSLSTNHDYSKNRLSGRETHSISNSANLRMTQNWSMSYSNRYDIVERNLISQTMTVVRDLHCWRIQFSYTTSATFWDYRVVLFNIQLPESLRLQQRNNSR